MIIGLDVDGVLANFTQAFINAGLEKGYARSLFPSSWRDQNTWQIIPEPGQTQLWKAIEHDLWFWLSIQPHEDAGGFSAPSYYITARPIPSLVTEAWLAL